MKEHPYTLDEEKWHMLFEKPDESSVWTLIDTQDEMRYYDNPYSYVWNLPEPTYGVLDQLIRVEDAVLWKIPYQKKDIVYRWKKTCWVQPNLTLPLFSYKENVSDEFYVDTEHFRRSESFDLAPIYAFKFNSERRIEPVYRREDIHASLTGWKLYEHSDIPSTFFTRFELYQWRNEIALPEKPCAYRALDYFPLYDISHHSWIQLPHVEKESGNLFQEHQCTNIGFPVEENEHPDALLIKKGWRKFITPLYKRPQLEEYPRFFDLNNLPDGYLTGDVANEFRSTEQPDGYFVNYAFHWLYDCSSHAVFVQEKPRGFFTKKDMNRLNVPFVESQKPDAYLIEMMCETHYLHPLYDCSDEPRWRLKMIMDNTYDPLKDQENYRK